MKESLRVLAAVLGVIVWFGLFTGCAPMLAKDSKTPADLAGEDESGEAPEEVYKITFSKPKPALAQEEHAPKKEKWEPKPMFPEAQQPTAKAPVEPAPKPVQTTPTPKPEPQPVVTATPSQQPTPTSTPYVDLEARKAADEAAAIALQARETAENAANVAIETAKVVIATAEAGQQGSTSSGNTTTATKPTFAAPTIPTDCKTNTAKELLFKNNHSLPVFLRIDGKYTTRWVQPKQTLLVCLPAETTKHVVEAFAGTDGVISQVAMKDPSLSIWDTDMYTGSRGGPFLALGSSNFRSYIPPTQPTKK